MGSPDVSFDGSGLLDGSNESDGSFDGSVLVDGSNEVAGSSDGYCTHLPHWGEIFHANGSSPPL